MVGRLHGTTSCLLNEFQSCFQLSTFLQLTDPEPPLLEIKGGFIHNRVCLFIITTNIDPEEQYGEVKEKNFDKWQAYRRRINKIIHSAPNPEWTDWEAEHSANYARPGYVIGTIPNKWSSFRTGFPGLLKSYLTPIANECRSPENAEGSVCGMDPIQIPETDDEQEAEPTNADAGETEKVQAQPTYTVGGTEAETLNELISLSQESLFGDSDWELESNSSTSANKKNKMPPRKRATPPESSDSEEELPIISLKPSKRAKYWSDEEMEQPLTFEL